MSFHTGQAIISSIRFIKVIYNELDMLLIRCMITQTTTVSVNQKSRSSFVSKEVFGRHIHRVNSALTYVYTYLLHKSDQHDQIPFPTSPATVYIVVVRIIRKRKAMHTLKTYNEHAIVHVCVPLKRKFIQFNHQLVC